MPIIKKHQTHLDFIAQHCGDMQGAWALIAANGISITGDPSPGMRLTVPEIAAPKVVTYFANEKIDLATLDNAEGNAGGIGFMQIGNDFIVS